MQSAAGVLNSGEAGIVQRAVCVHNAIEIISLQRAVSVTIAGEAGSMQLANYFR
jgi:hypothetical protein